MSRILFITSKPYCPWEGASHRIRHTLEALVALGHTVDVLTVPAGAAPDITGVNILSVPGLPLCRSLPDGPSVRRFLLDALMLFKAVFLSGRAAYAIIHGIDDGGVVACLASRLTKSKSVFETHPDFIHARAGRGRPAQALYRLFERYALKRADAVIGNDNSVVQTLARLGRRSRACVIPDIPAAATEAVTLPARNLAQARYRTSRGQKLVTCVGSFTRFQGLDLFFNAMPHVLAAHPQTRFAVVGGGEAEIQRMRDALSRARIDESVIFPGRILPAELSALLEVSDVLVSPRRAGTTAPIKVLDYLYSGTPIVAADTPANRAILTSGNALLTRPDPEALAAGILDLLDNPQRGQALAKQGRATLNSESRTPEAFRHALRNCYDYILAKA